MAGGAAMSKGNEKEKAKPFAPTGKTPDCSDVDRQRLLEDARAFAKAGRKQGDEVQEASEGSFPASDPPSFTPNTSIGPKESDST